jgi:hypothetical protein
VEAEIPGLPGARAVRDSHCKTYSVKLVPIAPEALSSVPTTLTCSMLRDDQRLQQFSAWSSSNSAAVLARVCAGQQCKVRFDKLVKPHYCPACQTPLLSSATALRDISEANTSNHNAIHMQLPCELLASCVTSIETVETAASRLYRYYAKFSSSSRLGLLILWPRELHIAKK